ncbi:MAG: D-alanyl-D-alanine carboxypeptidase family protein [Ruminococcus sp.]|nr:D-alanyl-D-alanine carboxypeptidase family protein [Ruminococcus sp.]
MSKKHIRKGRVFMLFALTVGTIVGADTIRRDFFAEYDSSIIVDGSFMATQTTPQNNNVPATMLNNNGSAPAQSASGITYLGYSEMNIPASKLSSGLLAVYKTGDAMAPVCSADMSFVSDVKNEFYHLRSNDIQLDTQACEALNRMMSDYNNATGLSNFVLYSTTQAYTGEDSVYTRSFAESASGLTVDLAVKGSSRVLEYDGCDKEAWITENCANYGFVVRYPQGCQSATGEAECVWHLRYVGDVHASIMKQNNLTLDEYNSWLKKYTIASPYRTTFNGVSHEIYYTAYMGDSTPVRVPVSGNYTISGNNTDGFVVTALK